MEAETSSSTLRDGPISAATAATEPAQTPAAFHYGDINVVSIDGIVPHLKIPASLPLFQVHPQLKQMVRVAVTHAIKELIGQLAVLCCSQ